MNAFYKYGDFLAKAYRRGDDWQVLSNGVMNNQSWTSVWSDNIEGSLKYTLERHCDLNNIPFLDDPNFLIICK